MAMIEVINWWIDFIVRYLSNEELFPSRKEAHKFQLKLRRYFLSNKILYQKSYLSPWLKFIMLKEENYILREIHEEIVEIILA